MYSALLVEKSVGRCLGYGNTCMPTFNRSVVCFFERQFLLFRLQLAVIYFARFQAYL